MYLQKLDLAGFKSFAHKTTLTFTRGITAIVGPNGSGKSNVADAIRWVLGEQSLKLLRGKKSEDVIFAGSDKKTRLGLAEVTLLLNNEDGSAPVDYAEVAITRRVDRDGHGEYLLNRAQARLQDIQLLLAKCNFGQQTYSVIGQGMVESFLTTSPAERKALFDDAAGVRQYQIKREQAMLKLQHAKENLTQAQALMEEIEPRLRSLTRAVRRLERREEVEAELRTQQTTHFARRVAAITAELEKQRSFFAELDGNRQAADTEVQTIQKDLEALERAESREERFVGLQKEYNAILDAKNERIREQSVLKGQLEVEAAKQGSLDRVLIEERLERIGTSAQALEEELAALERSSAADARRLDERLRDAQRQETRRGDVEKRLTALRASLHTQPQEEPEALRQNVEEILRAYDALLADFAALRELQRLPALLKEAKRIQDDLRSLAQALAKQSATSALPTLLRLQDELSALFRENEERRQSLEEARIALTEKRARAKVVREQREALAAERQRLDARRERLDHVPVSKEAAYSKYLEEKQTLDRDIAKLDEKLRASRAKITALSADEQAKNNRLFALQKHFRDAQQSLTTLASRVNDIKIEIAKQETRLADLDREMRGELPAAAVAEVTAQVRERRIAAEPADEALGAEILRLKHARELIGGIEEGTTEEYRETKERYDFLSTQSKDLAKAIEDLEEAIGELDATIKEQFQTAFDAIDKKFSNYFRTLFSGGTAKLVLIKEEMIPAPTGDEADGAAEEEEGEPAPPAPAPPREKIIAGVEIQATPPGKRLKNIAMLSGGERALTAIALLCAIIANNPSPFVVLDEVDAALDEANSQRFAAILVQLAEKTQFIVITHNRATMEKSHTLYGVTMGDDGISKLLSVKMEEAEKVIKTHGNR